MSCAFIIFLIETRYMKLFKNVASNKKNINNAVVSKEGLKNGVQGFSKKYKNGQVWVNVRNGKIINAGVNKTSR